MELRQSLFFVLAAALSALLFGVSATSAAPADGKKLVALHCEQCHEIKGISDFGNIGPSLVDVKSRYPDRKDLATIIFDETKRNPQTVMPPFGRNLILTKQEIETVVDYLDKQ